MTRTVSHFPLRNMKQKIAAIKIGLTQLSSIVSQLKVISADGNKWFLI